MQNVAYLSLGSNIGDREAHLRNAIEQIRKHGTVQAVSSSYETEPVEYNDQAWFLNCALALQTGDTPDELLRSILQIEQQMGRQRIQRKGPRTIDIDILLFSDVVLDTPDLTIPHPAMAGRRFVLEPLAEIAPDAMHPVLEKTIRELLSDLPLGQDVRKIQKT